MMNYGVVDTFPQDPSITQVRLSRKTRKVAEREEGIKKKINTENARANNGCGC